MTELVAAQQQRIAELEEQLAETQAAARSSGAADFRKKKRTEATGGSRDRLRRRSSPQGEPAVRRRANQQTPPPIPGQLDLELTVENAVIESAPAGPARAKGGSRKGRKVRAALLPENLPVEETVIIPLAVQAAPEKYRQIGEEVVERLERIPGRLVRLRLVRPTFVSIAEPYAAPVTAPAPPALLEGSFFGPQFMADMTLGKYLYHQPLYRQAKGIEWESGVKR